MTEDKKPLQTRHYLMAGALAATVAATLWAAQLGEDNKEEAVQATAGQRRTTPPVDASRSSVTSSVPAAPAPTDWSPIKREAFADVPLEQFAAWQPPPPPPPPPAPPAPPPPPPTAPAFPYQLIGRLQDGADAASAQAFLSGPQRSLAVRAGDTLDGQWRIEQIGATGLTVTYLPLQLKQTIAFRPAS